MELILNLNSSWLYCLLLLALVCLGLFWLALAASAACAFRSIATQVLGLMLAQFFALVTHFFDILTHLKLSCNFLTFFNDFSSSFGGFGVVWGWILGGFFEDF